jgi:hypothetical protein
LALQQERKITDEYEHQKGLSYHTLEEIEDRPEKAKEQFELCVLIEGGCY